MKLTEEAKPKEQEYIEINFTKDHDEQDDEVNNGELYSKKKHAPTEDNDTAYQGLHSTREALEMGLGNEDIRRPFSPPFKLQSDRFQDSP